MPEVIDVPNPRAAQPPVDATMSHVVYGLYALGFFNGITWIIGVIIAHLKRGDAADVWLDSHYSWQIRTFWWGLLWGILLGPAIFFFVVLVITIPLAFILGGIYVIWLVYRIVRGWLALMERKPMPA
jgi:uncharacterized membrane protein